MNTWIKATALLLPLLANGDNTQLVGEWSGAAKMVFNQNGSGYVSTGLCNFDIKWSATDKELTFKYVRDPECSYNDPQLGNIKKV